MSAWSDTAHRATDGHDWRGGYHCECGHELNSPQGYRRHLVEVLEADLGITTEEHMSRVEVRDGKVVETPPRYYRRFVSRRQPVGRES